MRTYDLLVVGAGSGNSILGPNVSHLKTAIVEPDRFGGTCLNRGCIPLKMLVVAADAGRGVTEARRLGVHASVERVDWPACKLADRRSLDPRIASDRGEQLHPRPLPPATSAITQSVG